ncbi:MAG: hypothetical protein ABIP93_00210 [Gemmatimonadaceae bacterium]
MSRYDWPSDTGGKERDDPAGRAAHNRSRRLEFDADGALRASRATQQTARRSGRAPGPFAPQSGRALLWQSLGPAALLGGQAEGSPRVSGRVNALAVHTDGQRVYAASANGGVWYSKDGGTSWVSVAGLASTNTAGILRPAQRNACGAIHVEFGAAEGDDLVFVGTGEVTHPMTGAPGESEGGIGILVANAPTQSAAADPWVREAPNLVNDGVFRIAREPGGPTTIAATRTGLYQRPAAPGLNVNWERPTSAPFDALADECSDLLWTPGDATRPARLWVWVKEGGSAGLWVRDAGTDEFERVAVAAGSYAYATPRRASLAASVPSTQIWVLNDTGPGPSTSLFRVTNPVTGPLRPEATGVVKVPNVMGGSGYYNNAIAVDPANPNRVAIAGNYLGDASNTASTTAADIANLLLLTTPDGARRGYDASIVVAEVAPDPANGNRLTYGVATPYTMIGVGVHPDVHALAYSNGGATLWTGCDGGVFRSDKPLKPAGFYARNDGLSISESNYVAGHPRCEGNLIAGLQDNGVVVRQSSGVWKLRYKGDGGGVAFDAVAPDRFMAQYVRGSWYIDPSVGTGPLVRTGGVIDATNPENLASAFYSTPASIAHVRTPTSGPPIAFSQTLIGTDRLWYSGDLGATWVTLPAGSTPGIANFSQDNVGQAIVVCRWQSPDVAWVLCAQQLLRYERVPNSHNDGSAGSWSKAPVMPAGYVPPGGKAKKRPPAPPSMLDSAVWTDVAVNMEPPAGPTLPPTKRGTQGAVYVGTIGKEDQANVDTLWWFDGTNAWHPTGLRAAVPAPVTAIVCNPAQPTEVWVGTTVGVWHGVRVDQGAAPPRWDWTQMVNGLPEAAVEDLTLFIDGTLVLLRAAIAARGVWEVRLDAPDTQDLVYVRAHDDDLRYRLPVPLIKRDLSTVRSWHGSPDVRPRTAPAMLSGPTPPSAWQRSAAPPRETLRRFQSALRASTGDARIMANGIWDAYFSEVLRDNAAPTVPVPAAAPLPAFNAVQINRAYWDLHMTPANALVEPWGTGTAREVDLYELTPPLTEKEVDKTSCELPARPSKVDVVVHRRGFSALNGANVRVTLLKWIDPSTPRVANWSDSTTWLTDPVPWNVAVSEVLNSSAGATTLTFGGGWSFVGDTALTRQMTLANQTLDSMRSGVATFDLDLSGLDPNTVVLLVAVVHATAISDGISADGTIPAPAMALPSGTLQGLALARPEVAVRSIQIIPG